MYRILDSQIKGPITRRKTMNLRNEIILEIQNAEKSFRAHFPQGVSYQECYDFLVKCAEKIIEMSKANEAAQNSSEAPSQPAATTPEENSSTNTQA